MKKIIIFLSIFWLAGCSTTPTLKDENDLSFHLTRTDIGTLPNPVVGRVMEDQQLLTTKVQGHELSFMSILHRDQYGLQLTALSAVGIRLFAIDYDGAAVRVTKYIPNMRLPDVNDIIANIMLAYYDFSVWKEYLPKDWIIEDHGLNRKILDQNDKIIIQIDYEKQHNRYLPIMITNNVLKYTINLKNLDD